MRCSLQFFVLAFLVWSNLATSAFAHTPTDPNFLQPEYGKAWKTLETPHFRIYHEAKHKEFARLLGAIAERVHTRLSAWLGWQPRDKTEVVILDSVDFSNGGASVIPYNRFFIYMPTPVEGEIMDSNPWLELVFTHEYTHILQMDMVSAAPEVMRHIFGRSTYIPFIAFTFPQLFAPSWVTEGLAVYSESNNENGYGRLNNAWFEAAMRMEVQRGLRSLTEESFEGYSCSRWPCGQIYLYGAYFFRFIEENYGQDKVTRYIRIYGRNVIPWRMDKRAWQIFGKPMKVVWQEYQDYLKRKFGPQLRAISQKSSIRTHTLYDAPYNNSLMAATGKGELYFYHDDDSSQPQVYRLLADGSSKAVFDADELINLDWQDTAGMLLSQLTVCDNVNAYADLYQWRPGMGKPEQLTHCGRYPIAAWRPDGQAIAAVQLDSGLSRLVLLDAHGNQTQTLTEMPEGDTLGHIAWSQDGSRIVASVKRLHTGWNLEILDLASRHWQKLTLNSDREIRPHFSSDGTAVYFLSDHDKVWNLRRIKLGSNSIETLSNTLSGISEAIAMPNGSFRLVEYTPRGLAITALDHAAAIGKDYAARDSKAPTVKAISTAADFQPLPYDQVTDYSPWKTMAPREWLPVAATNTDTTSYVGLLLSGSDVLGFHNWAVAPTYYTSLQALGGSAYYDFHHTLTFAILRQFTTHSAPNGLARYRDDEARYQVLAGHSFNSFESSRYLAIGIAGEKINSKVFRGTGANLSYRDTLAGAIMRYDNTDFYRRSISLTDGRAIQLSGESYDAFGTNFYSGKTYRLDWREYFGLGSNHVLLLRWQRAHGDPGIRPYILGGESPPANTLGADLELGRRNFPLRGYPSGSPSLVGTQFTLGTLEWRIPLGMDYDGYFIPPLGVGRQSLTLFVDSGDAWNNGERVRLKTGAGVEWKVETLIGYDLLHLAVTTGFAHGFDKREGVNHLYLRIGLPF